MKFKYFANVMAHIEFEIEAATEEEADELASEFVNKAPWSDFEDVGHEIGRFTGPNHYDWEQVERCGDI